MSSVLKEKINEFGKKVTTFIDTAKETVKKTVAAAAAAQKTNQRAQTPTAPLVETAEPKSATYSENISGGAAPTSGTDGMYSQYAAAPAAASEEKAADNVMSYEDYIAEMKRGYQEQLDAANKQAEQTKARAMAEAETAYSQNKATYGSNGETMAQMGLNGGGYSDYLNAQAYAQKRADVQVAKAQEIVSKDNARATYQQYIQAANEKLAEKALYDERLADQRAYEKEQKRQNVYDNILTDIINPDTKYTSEAIDSIAKEYEFSDEQTNALKNLLQTTLNNKAATTEQNKQDEIKNKSNGLKVQAITQIETEGGLSADYIQSLIDAGMQQSDINDVIKYNQDWYYKTFRNALNAGEFMSAKDLKSAKDDKLIAEGKYKELLDSLQKNYYDSYNALVEDDFASINTREVDKMYNDENLSKSQYNDIKNKFNSEIASVISAGVLFYENGVQIDEARAKELAQAFKNTGWLSSNNATALDTLLTNAYKEEDSGGGGCFAKGTLITLDNGSQVPIETLKEGDSVLVFNHITGKADAAKILFIYYEGVKVFDILKLHFDKTQDTEIIAAHGLFDLDLNKYVIITFDNVSDYIGHKFLCIDYKDGKTIFNAVVLTEYETHQEETECYAVITTKHINCMANRLLSIPDNNNKPPKLLGFGANLFDYNADHTYNKEQMENDIEKYGLVTYEDWRNLAPNNIDLSDLFFGIGGEYLKIALGKGYMTLNDLQGYIEIGAAHNGNH